MSFDPDPRLSGDSILLGSLELCQVRLMNERRWPWLLLVPQREGLREVHELGETDLVQAARETALAGRALSDVTGCDKINHGSLGNIVAQLHFHVIARSAGDANWPGPVWGYGERKAYATPDLDRLGNRLRQTLSGLALQSREHFHAV